MLPYKRIRKKVFLKMFSCENDTLPRKHLIDLEKTDTSYRHPTTQEIQEYALEVLKKIDSPDIARTREENLRAFEHGWRKDLENIKINGINARNLKPSYFRPSKFLRFNKDLIAIKNPQLEYEFFTAARHIIFYKYLTPFDTIYEIGCGNCQNLFFLSELFPRKNLYGLDWAAASTEIADFIARSLKRNITVSVFDMFKPSVDKPIKSGSAIITIHALEQLGVEFNKLISFILAMKPSIVIHYEPILEFYDKNNFLDYLALMYSKKRGYLDGYFTALRKLEAKKQIQIIEARRPYVGGVIHEASLCVWRPL